MGSRAELFHVKHVEGFRRGELFHAKQFDWARSLSKGAFTSALFHVKQKYGSVYLLGLPAQVRRAAR